jgi:LysM repeat protein
MQQLNKSQWAGGHRYEDDATLANLCTTTCNTALSTWLRRTAGACTTRFVGSNGDAILPAYWVEKVVEKYNVVCLKNGVSFCNAVLRDVLGINPVDQKQTKSAATTATCDECLLKRMQTQLQMPLLSNPDLATTFTSLTKKCSKTGFAVTTPAVTTQYVTKGAPPTTSVGVPTPTAGSCIGTKYTIKTGDTCQSVSLAQGLSTADLLIQNNLQAFCVNFPTAGSLCIPTEAKCKTYTVKTGDKCASIADANKLTWTQMVTWNPNFGQGCESIGKFTGWTACVSNPGGDWINPSPTSEITLSTLIPTIHGTFAGLLPKPTFGGFLNGSDTWAYKYADKTRLDCWIYANGTQFGTSTSCADVAKGYGVTTQNLTDWNPSLLSNGCMLDGKLTYCVQPMKLNATKYTQYCVLSDTPEYGLTCADFMAAWSLDFEDFSGWNPGVGAACENWVLGR